MFYSTFCPSCTLSVELYAFLVLILYYLIKLHYFTVIICSFLAVSFKTTARRLTRHLFSISNPCYLNFWFTFDLPQQGIYSFPSLFLVYSFISLNTASFYLIYVTYTSFLPLAPTTLPEQMTCHRRAPCTVSPPPILLVYTYLLHTTQQLYHSHTFNITYI